MEHEQRVGGKEGERGRRGGDWRATKIGTSGELLFVANSAMGRKSNVNRGRERVRVVWMNPYMGERGKGGKREGVLARNKD